MIVLSFHCFEGVNRWEGSSEVSSFVSTTAQPSEAEGAKSLLSLLPATSIDPSSPVHTSSNWSGFFSHFLFSESLWLIFSLGLQVGDRDWGFGLGGG